MRKVMRRLKTKRWVAGLAMLSLLSVSAVKANAETDMGPFMQSIGVPASNVLYFGWTPIGTPSALDAGYEDRWNFGLAVYEYAGDLRFTFVNGQTTTPLLDTIFTSFFFDDGSLSEAGVYFNNGTIVADSPVGPPVLWTSATGVNFHSGGGNLPEGNSLADPFNTTDGISWERNTGSGGVGNGVNSIPEYVTFNYDYVGVNTLSSVAQAFLDGDIRIGTHVQGLAEAMDIPSEAILWTPITDDTPPPPGPLDPVVPVPGAAGLGLLGMALVAKFRKKFVK